MLTYCVSYGEETITENNLLEIRRRHPELVRVRTFPKHKEAKNGAELGMAHSGEGEQSRCDLPRDLAKRLQCNGILKVKYRVESSGRQQRSLLIAGARAARMKPSTASTVRSNSERSGHSQGTAGLQDFPDWLFACRRRT